MWSYIFNFALSIFFRTLFACFQIKISYFISTLRAHPLPTMGSAGKFYSILTGTAKLTSSPLHRQQARLRPSKRYQLETTLV